MNQYPTEGDRRHQCSHLSIMASGTISLLASFLYHQDLKRGEGTLSNVVNIKRGDI